MNTYILAHDLGTTGDKATLFDDRGRLIASAFMAYETLYPKPGWAEQVPEHYWEAFCASSRAIIEQAKINPKEIQAVSFSGQMMAALPVDSEGTALRNAIIWADQRSVNEASLLDKSVGFERFYRITGNRLSASYPVFKIMWIKKNEPEIYKRTCRFIGVKDYVGARLTGNIITDFSDGSAMAMLDIEALSWADEIVRAAGIDRQKLPDLSESISVTGRVGKDAAAESGLSHGTAVVKGAGDGPCATAGAGVVHEGESYFYLGTSTWMGLATKRPYIDPLQRTHTFCHFVKGLYAPAGAMQSGGGSLQWLKGILYDHLEKAPGNTGVDPYDLIGLEAEHVPAGSGGLLFLPYLMGERCPLWDPDARGCFIGLSATHTRRHIARAVMEGVCFNMRLIAKAFQDQGASFGLIRMIGGGAKSRIWCRILADVMQREIHILRYREEATSIGAAVAGGVGVGIFSSIDDAGGFAAVEEVITPQPGNKGIYTKYLDLFQQSYRSLSGVFRSQ
ncbi:MAG: xylulokinase [Spirochaetes bacterium]|nr:xylulokinase [Spirochaetota bacterium]